MTKPFTFDGQTMTRAQWAEELGIAVPAFARRVRRYEAGLMSLAEVMTPGNLPPKIPRRERDPEEKSRLVAALEKHNGSEIAIANEWGVARQWVNTLVHKHHLVKFARALRKPQPATMEAVSKRIDYLVQQIRKERASNASGG